MSDQQEGVITLIVTDDHRLQYKRLDQFLTQNCEDLSRNTIKSLFTKGSIFAKNDTKLELKKMPVSGTEIIVKRPKPAPCSLQAENIPLDILFEDEHLVIVNKKAGMVVHPAPGHYTGTLVNAILYHCHDLTGVGDEKRPGIVHRLDKGTSGVMVVAKNAKCHEGLVNLFSQHDITREYVAIVMNRKLAVGGTIEATVGRHPTNRLKMAANVRGGKDAKTFYNVLESFPYCHYIKCKLETGRTHQIRVHLSQMLNAPLLNDPLYGRPKDHLRRLGPEVETHLSGYEHPLLHAKTLGFVHPITKEELIFTQEPPEVFQKTLHLLQKQSQDQNRHDS